MALKPLVNEDNFREFVVYGGASARTGVSERTIRRAVANNELRAYRVGSRVVLRISDLDAWITAVPARGGAA